METKTKQNGTAKRIVAVKKDVKEQLAKQAIGQDVQEVIHPLVSKATIDLADRIQRFEKLRGLATQRERLVQTLSELTKFNYNQGDSASFYIRDSHNLEFKTTNTNLIKLVTTHLQSTLETRKTEIEQEIIQFEL
ncbi:hypothetical protein [Snuella sedimenti]|uniref:Uncharacterized protein n=1 Tax=Snuella sedimenti TaxID=2798802 RepID=A0A8J7IH71_9FLAO|nr:hypothetical protein [Snuella sedimenti]MBJ6367711.1 hypothetical protein [Snuella sedimenti]